MSLPLLRAMIVPELFNKSPGRKAAGGISIPLSDGGKGRFEGPSEGGAEATWLLWHAGCFPDLTGGRSWAEIADDEQKFNE
ncbi:hypothetical protein [Pseudorhizobium pelagicum]|uniref:hypothetical protein n=1 Tax=Pseudorhizobium pelagicum TaxID=1509405 RepID=UPI001111577B|nr:hypothetical protein [Pseudorhizobium pelagicum]MDY6962663.1 hypothetical protein [Pseudomonadota bacterium]